MVAWAVRTKEESVLDPSCGDGVFLGTAAERLRSLGASPADLRKRVRGFDLNQDAVVVTSSALRPAFGAGRTHAIREANFFDVDPPSETGDWIDVLLGNPPYIRYQDFSGKSRERALARTAALGVPLTQLTSSWAPFVLHALSFIREGGRAALILPAELIHAAYALPLRRHLLRVFQHTYIVSFRNAVFPDVQEEVVLLLASEKGANCSGTLHLVEAMDGTELQDLPSLLCRAEIHSAAEEPIKWTPGFSSDPSVPHLTGLAASGAFGLLAEIGKANIGFVSGANDYFVLTNEEIKRWRLPRGSMRPAVIKAKQIPGAILSEKDISQAASTNERCLLWHPAELDASERAYVGFGEESGISHRYKCRVRSPWYLVPGVAVPDAFLTYMSDAIPRLCLNRAGAVAANTLLTVRLPYLSADLHPAFVAGFYNSATLLSCERIGRSYGGGVLKLEPREADRLLVPSAALLKAHAKELKALLPGIDDALRAASPEQLLELIERVDSVVLAPLLDSTQTTALRRSRLDFLTRRRSRARSSRDRTAIETETNAGVDG